MKKNSLLLALCALSSIGLAACGGTGTSTSEEKPFGAAENFKVDASTGDYSFTRVNGAEKYKITLYFQADYDVATNTVAEGADEVYSATIKQKDSETIKGNLSYIAEGAWGKYVAVLVATGASETATTTYSYVHGGKLNTPEFYVWQGNSSSSSGPKAEGTEANNGKDEGIFLEGEGGGDTTGDQPGGENQGSDSGNEGDAGNTGGETGGETGGAGQGSGSGGSSDGPFVMQITINTDSYLTTQYETQAVYSFAYVVKDEKGNVVAESDCFADNIQPAGFTLYTNNVAELETVKINGVDTKLSDLYGETFYISVKANGNADDNVEDSDWSEPFKLTLTEGSTIPFDAGFGRPSNIGGGGATEEEGGAA